MHLPHEVSLTEHVYPNLVQGAPNCLNLKYHIVYRRALGYVDAARFRHKSPVFKLHHLTSQKHAKPGNYVTQPER